MLFVALIIAGGLAPAESAAPLSDRYSIETKKKIVAYTTCFARGIYERRQAVGSPEEHMRQAKTECIGAYNDVVISATRDRKSDVDEETAATEARRLLDAMDTRAIIGPLAPASLSHLPVEQLVGRWQCGKGPLAETMEVAFSGDGSITGVLNSTSQLWLAHLRGWKIISNGVSKATFHAILSTGKEIDYDLIPSPPPEMNFVKVSHTEIQRFDILVEDGDLLLRWVEANGNGGQARFERVVGFTTED